MNLKDRLKGHLDEEEMGQLVRSFEIIGCVAITNLPDELEQKKEDIARAICEQHKQVTCVLNKVDKTGDEFRIPGYEVLLGENSETTFVEHSCRFRLDPRKVYFSERLGTERKRVVDLVLNGELVCVFFAGVGPYAIEIGKLAEPQKVVAIEKNPQGFQYLVENIQLNKVGDIVDGYLGDVLGVVPSLDLKFDRIVMPLPKFTFDFLELALKYLKEKGVIHFYTFSEEGCIEELVERLKEVSYGFGYSIEIIDIVKCGHYSPRVYRYCIDFTIV